MKIKEGDVFTIPVDENRVGFGQIIKIPNKNNFIIVVFQEICITTEIPAVNEIINFSPLFLGYTMDAKLYHKHWKIIGNNNSNIDLIPLPNYRLGTPPDDIYITDYSGKVLRPAKKEEYEKLEHKTVRAPVGYENALKAYHNLKEWQADDNKLLFKNVIKQVV